MIGKPSKNKHSYNVYTLYVHDIVALTMRVTIIDNGTHNINNNTARRRSVPIYGVYFEDCFFRVINTRFGAVPNGLLPNASRIAVIQLVQNK